MMQNSRNTYIQIKQNIFALEALFYTYHVRKLLVECLVLSKLDYAAAVFYPLPLYQLKRLQRVQNACAGFILGRYANENDLHTLNWLPMSNRRDFLLY